MTIDRRPLQAQVTTDKAFSREIIEQTESTQLPVMISIRGYGVPTPSPSCQGPTTLSEGGQALASSLTGEEAPAGQVQSPAWNSRQELQQAGFPSQ